MWESQKATAAPPGTQRRTIQGWVVWLWLLSAGRRKSSFREDTIVMDVQGKWSRRIRGSAKRRGCTRNRIRAKEMQKEGMAVRMAGRYIRKRRRDLLLWQRLCYGPTKCPNKEGASAPKGKGKLATPQSILVRGSTRSTVRQSGQSCNRPELASSSTPMHFATDSHDITVRGGDWHCLDACIKNAYWEGTRP